MVEKDDCEDARLLLDRERPQASLAAFYRRNVELVLRLCARRGLDAPDAADLTAEVFASVVMNRYRFDPVRGAARSWLLGVAEHKLADRRRWYLRDDRTRRRLSLAAVSLTERDVADYAALRAQVERARAEIQALPADQRSAVTARLFGDESYEQIGKRLGISEAAARQRVSRGMSQIRRGVKEQT